MTWISWLTATLVLSITPFLVYAAIVFAVAWHAAHGPTFRGDSRWAAYWLVSSSGWLLLAWKSLLPKHSASSSHS